MIYQQLFFAVFPPVGPTIVLTAIPLMILFSIYRIPLSHHRIPRDYFPSDLRRYFLPEVKRLAGCLSPAFFPEKYIKFGPRYQDAVAVYFL